VKNKTATVHPYIRIASAILLIAGAAMSRNVYFLTLGWLLIIIPLHMILKVLRKHLLFLVYAILPILFLLMIVYSIFLPTFQSANALYTRDAGIQFALVTVLKLVFFTAILQLTLHIPDEELFTTLRAWGIKKDGLVIYLGALTIWADVRTKGNKIVDARFARGLVKNRSLWQRIRQIPFVVRPLIGGILASSVERSQSWRQKQLLSKIENLKSTSFRNHYIASVILILISIFWFTASVYLKYK
jgi:energy-coupling factor transporter transmembrane protein EcfT